MRARWSGEGSVRIAHLRPDGASALLGGESVAAYPKPGAQIAPDGRPGAAVLSGREAVPESGAASRAGFLDGTSTAPRASTVLQCDGAASRVPAAPSRSFP